MAKPPDSVERKIYFYRADAGRDEAGRPRELAITQIAQALSGLPFAGGERYLETADGNALCCWVDRQRPLQRIRFGTIRRLSLIHI